MSSMVPFRLSRRAPLSRCGKTALVAVIASDARAAGKVSLTLDQLWQAFLAERARGWRSNTLRIYTEGCGPFANIAGQHNPAEDIGRETMAKLVTELEARRLAVNTIQKTLSVVRQVYALGLGAELIEKNKVALFRYRVAKEKRPQSPDEYGMAEFGKLLEALPLDRKGT